LTLWEAPRRARPHGRELTLGSAGEEVDALHLAARDARRALRVVRVDFGG
jgi:hypothetical protein